MEMLIDYMGYLSPEVRLDKRDQWIRGIKLLPEDGRADSGYLYFAQQSDIGKVTGEAPVVYIAGNRPFPPEIKNCIVVRADTSVTAVFNELLGTQNLLRSWEQEVELSVSRREGLQRLLDLSGRVFGNPIAVITTAFKTIAATWEYETDDTTFWELIELGYLTRDTFTRLQEKGYFSLDRLQGDTIVLEADELRKYPTTLTAISQNNSVGFFVLMLCNNTPVTRGLMQLYGYFIEKIKYYLLPVTETSDYLRNQFDYFIIDIIEGRVSTPREIMERSLVYPPTYTADYNTVLVVHEGNSAMYLEHAMQNMSVIFSNVRQILYNGSIILHPDLERSPARRNHFLATLSDYLQSAKAYAGVSESFNGLVTIRESYRQAKAALTLGRKLNGLGLTETMLGVESHRSRIYHFSDYHIYSMLLGDEGTLGILDQVRKHDLEHNTDYYRILYVFLSTERNFTKAAAILGMHRNNVIYHAKRMSEIFGIDFENHNHRLRLLMLYKLDDMIQAGLSVGRT